MPDGADPATDGARVESSQRTTYCQSERVPGRVQASSSLGTGTCSQDRAKDSGRRWRIQPGRVDPGRDAVPRSMPRPQTENALNRRWLDAYGSGFPRLVTHRSRTPWCLREQTALQNGSRFVIATGGRSFPHTRQRPSSRTLGSLSLRAQADLRRVLTPRSTTCHARSSSAASASLLPACRSAELTSHASFQPRPRPLS